MSMLSLQRVIVTVVLLVVWNSSTSSTRTTTVVVEAFGIGDGTWMNGIFNKQIKINKNQSVTKILFDKLNKLIDEESPKNGIDTPPEIETEIIRIAQVLGKYFISISTVAYNASHF